MRFIFLLLTLVLIAGTTSASSDSPKTTDDPSYAVVIFKYDAQVNVWERSGSTGEYAVASRGGLYRSFPTGPKTIYGDERIPEGIYRAKIDSEGNISFRFETLPGMFEIYRLTGPSLDRNVIPMRAEAFEAVRAAAMEMHAAGVTSIPVVILPGKLETDVADALSRARNVRQGQTLADVEYSVRRWKPVEEYIINSGRIPKLRFDGADIIILGAADAANVSAGSDAFAGRSSAK
jgi:hypothetical protein